MGERFAFPIGRRIKAILLFLLLVVPMPAAGSPPEPLSLEEAVETALKNHPQGVEAIEAVTGAEARTGQVAAAYYPQISFAADWSRGRTFFPSLENTKQIEARTATINLKQNLYDFGRTESALEASRENQAAARQALAFTRQDIAFRVKTAYFLLLASERQVIATQDIVRAREEVYRQAGEYFRQGIRPKVDVTRAEANLYASRTALVRAENNRDLARVELFSAMGMPAPDERTLSEQLLTLPALPDRAALRQEAIETRAELKRLHALENAAAAGVKVARSGELPILSGTAGAGRASRDDSLSGDTWNLGVNLTVPIFTGYATTEQIREAKAALRAVQAQQANLRLQILKQVESAWLLAREASARFASTEKEVAAARENQTLAAARYREGVGTIIEVSDAQSQALEAETANVQAIYDSRVAIAQIERAVGKE
ncbi:MAG: TolC family protein [Smithellaceae bacterium]|nr:TolC family protein [Smithellaceae bacterium]